jgi:hypothetical protein
MDAYFDKYKLWKNKYKQAVAKIPNLKGGKIKLGSQYPKFIVNNFFPLVDRVDRQLVSLDDKIKNMSTVEGVTFISNIIKEKMGSNIVFTNLTPEAYADTISFSYKVQNQRIIIRPKVSNESKKMIYDNIKLYNLQNKIQKTESKIEKALKRTVQDVIYFDHVIDRSVSLLNITDKYHELTRSFVFRVDNKFDFNSFLNKVKSNSIEIYKFTNEQSSFSVIYLDFS